MKRVCVIGSINMDIVYKVEKFVKPGETVEALQCEEHFGGKGGNQAVACARLGAAVSMVGCVGEDEYGSRYLQNLKDNYVNCFVASVPGLPTGRAFIEISKEGENRIVICHGANGAVDVDYVKRHEQDILEHDIFLLQQEIPQETNDYLLALLRRKEKTVILDPAPARPVKPESLAAVSYLTPNETELCALGGMKEMTVNVKKLCEIGVEHVICKAGGDGAYSGSGGALVHFPAQEVETVQDTTGAGDTFNGALACAIAMGKSVEDEIRFANRAAGLSIQAAGAQTGMPWAAEWKE